MTERSARFALPLLQPGQAQKEVFHNEAVIATDLLLHAAVEGPPAADPPPAPEAGQCWIVGEDATGAWAGQGDRIAAWTSAGWRFLIPRSGTQVWSHLEGLWRHWTGSEWSDGWLPAAGLIVDGQQVVGRRQPGVPSPSGGTTIDAEARAAVTAVIVALRTHGLID